MNRPSPTTCRPNGCRALVLEGGGSRGAFQAGVLWYLHDHPESFPVDFVCGTSVGALNAAAFAFGKVEELVRLWSRLHSSQIYRRRRWLELGWELATRGTFTHVHDVHPMRALLEDLFGERLLADSPMPLYISAFNMQTGMPVLFGPESAIRVVDAILASTALQGFFPPHVHHGFQYIDGGNGLNLPLGPALESGARDLLMVCTTGGDEFTPGTYRDVLSIQKRAYSVLLSRTTRSDLAQAQARATLLDRWRAQREELQSAIESMVSEPGDRARLLERLARLPALDEAPTPLRLRLLEPPLGVPLPDLLEFDPALSLSLLHLGYERAHQLLEDHRHGP